MKCGLVSDGSFVIMEDVMSWGRSGGKENKRRFLTKGMMFSIDRCHVREEFVR